MPPPAPGAGVGAARASEEGGSMATPDRSDLAVGALQLWAPELAAERRQLDADRRRFAEEQAYLRQYWQRRLRSEWQRLECEAEQLASQRQDDRARLRDANAAAEVERRQLEARWNALRREQLAWRGGEGAGEGR